MLVAQPTQDQFKPDTVPAPIGGLNAFASLAAMEPTDAVVMQNWWPQPYGCAVRNGYIEWNTGLPSTVETLAGWYDNLGNQKLFSWSVGSMYDSTTRAAIGAAIVAGLTNARWQHVVLTNAADNYLIAVNGIDNGIIYRTAGVARITAGDGIVANTWAGLNPQNAIQLTVHQKRLWATEINSSKGWYLPADAIQGTFASFDFGPQFSKGGYLQYLSTWTLDDGNGAEDHLVAVSSNGEAVVYAGTNPADSTKWSLVGVYYVGAPVSGRRSYVKAGGDLLLVTQRGVVSMTAELVSTKVENAESTLTSRKIQFLISELVSTYSALNGWQILYFATANMVLVAVPSVTTGGNAQLAANQITKAWTQFIDMDAACWVTHNNLLYFGDYSGRVLQAWTGSSDGVLLDNTGGAGIRTAVQQAYNYFGGRSNPKQIGLYRPVFSAGQQPAFTSYISYDFRDYTLSSPSGASPTVGSVWGTALWGTALWGGGVSIYQDWVSAEGVGACASLLMSTLTNSETLWISTDYSIVQSRGLL